MNLFFVCGLLFMLTDSFEAQNCSQDGYFQAGSNCYKVSQYAMNWFQAQEVSIMLSNLIYLLIIIIIIIF